MRIDMVSGATPQHSSSTVSPPRTAPSPNSASQPASKRSSLGPQSAVLKQQQQQLAFDDSGSTSLSDSTLSLHQHSDASSRLGGQGTDSTFHSPSSTSAFVAGGTAAGTAKGEESDPEDIAARIERKRQEHERQRALQRQAFEQQMALLERQQLEEEANMLGQRQSPAASAGGADDRAAHRLSNPIADGSRPEEGLNGSNVPGLAPVATNTPPRSVPASRRTSGGQPEAMTTADQVRLAGQRRSMNANEMATAFDRMGLGSNHSNDHSNASSRPSSQPRSPIGAGPPGGNPAGDGSPTSRLQQRQSNLGGNSTTGQQSVLQRAIGRHNIEAQQQHQHPHQAQNQAQNQHQSQSGANAAAGESGLTPVFNERYLLFDDELDAEDSAFMKRYSLEEDDDKFPVLIRRDSFPGMLSASSAALDLAPLSQAPSRFPRTDDGSSGNVSNNNPPSRLSEWPQFAGRDDGVTGGAGAGAGGRGTPSPSQSQSQHALADGASFDRFGNQDRRGRSERNSPRLSSSQGPVSNNARSGPGGAGAGSGVGGGGGGGGGGVGSAGSGTGAGSFSLSSSTSPGGSTRHSTTPGTPTSTLSVRGSAPPSAEQQQQQQQQQHGGLPRSATLSRFPGQTPHRLSNQFSGRDLEQEMNKERQRQYSANALNAPSGLAQPDMDDPARKENRFPGFSMDAFAAEEAKANHQNGGNNAAARFGSSYTGGFERSTSADHSAARPQSGYFDAFARGGPPGPPGPGAGQQPAGPVGYGPAMAAGGNNNSFPPFGSLSPESAKGGSLIKNRKGELDANTPLEELQGEIFALCKDQHGCRYLQKKLEEGVPSYRDMIFAETFSHFAELMTDPFGNYLCQKMLEYCTDEQRNLIVESVAPELVTISLNMHGTRAVQKTIDFLSTPRQISSIIVALSMSVVTLIKDLNGNHVIQKCLNRLSSDDNQFIYNAVAAHCVEVATHRHGCCVLQRCVDHASDSQRIQLVSEITYNALTLVQDPFGNYVVQYILDLNDPRFSDAVIRQFVGNVCLLSVQKFSSNVIEKCIRVSDVKLRRSLIDELLNRTRLEKLLRDSFANYVVQTSLDYAEPMQRMQLVECIRPILPMIRNTPYGKRIQSKLQRDNIELAPPGNVHFSLLQAAHHQQLQAMAAIANRQTTASDYVGNINPYNTAAHGAMHRQPGTPHGPHRPPHHHGGPPPPQQASMYGGQQPPAQFAGGRLPPPHHHHHPAAGFGAGGPPPAPPPGVGMGGSGPSTPNLGGPHGHHHGQHHHQQAPNYPPAYAYGAGGGMPSPMALHGQFPGYGAPF